MKKIALYFCLMLGAGGCRKFVNLPPPDTQLSTASIFASDASAISFLMGIYSEAMAEPGSLLNGGASVYAGLSSDEMTTTVANTAVQDFANNTLSSDNFYLLGLYGNPYHLIYSANMLLEQVPGAAGITATTKRQLEGEAYFIRGLLYSQLVDLFGDVPLQHTTNTDSNAVMPRSTVGVVYAAILRDLLAADSLLDVAYAAPADDPGARSRPNKWAARALLARVYLYMGNWAAADAAASAVITAGSGYLLEPVPDSVFLTGSRETIWQLQPVNPITNTTEGYYFVPNDNAAARPGYLLTAGLMGAFESGDQRQTHWTKVKTINGVGYVYPFKYHVNTGIYPCREEAVVLRLAELYLIRAEARAQEGLLTEALNDLDLIRARAGLAPLAGTLSRDELLTAVAQERRVEFFAEWGHRWSDLKRTGKANSVLAPLKAGWAATDQLYPIIATDLARNPFLKQNPGY